jgi:hypothetical protein
VRENRMHGSEGGEDINPSRPLSQEESKVATNVVSGT